MDTTDHDIQFTENGICNHCKTFEKRKLEITIPYEKGGKEKINHLVKKIKKAGNGKKYDCLIGVSGGVDSSFIAYIVKKLGLRPLAVHLDNGWNSELAVNNIEKLLKKLDIDLYTHVINWEEFKNIQLAFLRSSTPDAEQPTDHAILAILYRVAVKQRIKYIIMGGNHNSEGILPNSWSYGTADWKYISGIIKKFGKGKIKTWPHFNFLDYIFFVYIKKIKPIRILDYLSYNRENAMQIIEDKLSWKYYGGKHYESIYTRFFQSYILPKKFNIDKRKAHYSSLICSGQITKEEALKKIKKDTYSKDKLKEDKIYVIKKLGLTENEFEKIMSLPIKSFRDYPNNYYFFNILFTLRNFLKKFIKNMI